MLFIHVTNILAALGQLLINLENNFDSLSAIDINEKYKLSEYTSDTTIYTTSPSLLNYAAAVDYCKGTGADLFSVQTNLNLTEFFSHFETSEVWTHLFRSTLSNKIIDNNSNSYPVSTMSSGISITLLTPSSVPPNHQITLAKVDDSYKYSAVGKDERKKVICIAILRFPHRPQDIKRLNVFRQNAIYQIAEKKGEILRARALANRLFKGLPMLELESQPYLLTNGIDENFDEKQAINNRFINRTLSHDLEKISDPIDLIDWNMEFSSFMVIIDIMKDSVMRPLLQPVVLVPESHLDELGPGKAVILKKLNQSTLVLHVYTKNSSDAEKIETVRTSFDDEFFGILEGDRINKNDTDWKTSLRIFWSTIEDFVQTYPTEVLCVTMAISLLNIFCICKCCCKTSENPISLFPIQFSGSAMMPRVNQIRTKPLARNIKVGRPMKTKVGPKRRLKRAPPPLSVNTVKPKTKVAFVNNEEAIVMIDPENIPLHLTGSVEDLSTVKKSSLNWFRK